LITTDSFSLQRDEKRGMNASWLPVYLGKENKYPAPRGAYRSFLLYNKFTRDNQWLRKQWSDSFLNTNSTLKSVLWVFNLMQFILWKRLSWIWWWGWPWFLRQGKVWQ
jgi:hypothetical protein